MASTTSNVRVSSSAPTVTEVVDEFLRSVRVNTPHVSFGVATAPSGTAGIAELYAEGRKGEDAGKKHAGHAAPPGSCQGSRRERV